MANYLDYLRWRGDITFSKAEFNEIDGAIFANLIYFPINKVLNTKSEIHLFDVIDNLLRDPETSIVFNKVQQLFLKLLLRCPRYKSIKLTNFKYVLKQKPAMQFTAMRLQYAKHKSIIVYRGTDHSIIGWNEDMTMSYADKIEGQETAAQYFNQIANSYPNDKFRLVGHSKGGNFAIYAAAFSHKKNQEKIVSIYNYDGPGFVPKIYNHQSYKNIQAKILNIMPQGSIFGLMLEHPEKIKIVRSERQFLDQHDPISWDVTRDYFIQVDSFLKSSNIIDGAIKNWVKEISPEQREQLWSALFESMHDLNITNIDQIMNNKIKGIQDLSKVYLSLSPENRKIASKIFEELMNNIKDNYSFNLNSKNKK